MLEFNEIYNSIVIEFGLNSSIFEMKSEVEALARSKRELCKLLKITVFQTENLDTYEKEFIKNIDINKSKIIGFEKNKIELKYKINVSKEEISVIKLHIKELENSIAQERKQSKKYNEALRIFLRREKFKAIKKFFLKNYRRVFLRYSNELSIKTKIMECNKRKEKIRQEKQYLNNNLNKYKKKIIMDKISLSQMRKSIINMEKGIDFFLLRIESLSDYRQMENMIRIKYEHYEN